MLNDRHRADRRVGRRNLPDFVRPHRLAPRVAVRPHGNADDARDFGEPVAEGAIRYDEQRLAGGQQAGERRFGRRGAAARDQQRFVARRAGDPGERPRRRGRTAERTPAPDGKRRRRRARASPAETWSPGRASGGWARRARPSGFSMIRRCYHFSNRVDVVDDIPAFLRRRGAASRTHYGGRARLDASGSGRVAAVPAGSPRALHDRSPRVADRDLRLRGRRVGVVRGARRRARDGGRLRLSRRPADLDAVRVRDAPLLVSSRPVDAARGGARVSDARRAPRATRTIRGDG